MHWSNLLLLALSSGSLGSKWQDKRHGARIAADRPDDSASPTKKWIIEFAKVRLV